MPFNSMDEDASPFPFSTETEALLNRLLGMKFSLPRFVPAVASAETECEKVPRGGHQEGSALYVLSLPKAVNNKGILNMINTKHRRPDTKTADFS